MGEVCAMQGAMQGFEVRAGEMSGVYMLFWEGEVVKVKGSRNVVMAVSVQWYEYMKSLRGKHSESKGWVVPFDRVRVVLCPKEEVRFKEAELVRLYNPRCNRVATKTPRRLVSLERLAERVKWNAGNSESSSRSASSTFRRM